MTDLRRTKNCGFSIENAVELKDVSEEKLISPEKFLEKYPRVDIFGFGAKLIKSGQEVKLTKYFKDCDEGFVRLYENGFLGLGVIRRENEEKLLKAYLIFEV